MNKRRAQLMTFIDEKTEEAREDKIFDEGGYLALWRYKVWKMFENLKGGTCCNICDSKGNSGASIAG
jgi:hypothetical protein